MNWSTFITICCQIVIAAGVLGTLFVIGASIAAGVKQGKQK